MNNNNDNYPVLAWICLITALLLIAGYLCSCSASKPLPPSPVKWMTIQIISDDEKRDGVTSFIIERSRDGVTWAGIDSIHATGNAFYNDQIPEAVGFYRLKINKFSGIEYKNVINVK